MADVLVLVSTCGFFGLCIAYIRWCDRIIGDDLAGSVAEESGTATERCNGEEVAA